MRKPGPLLYTSMMALALGLSTLPAASQQAVTPAPKGNVTAAPATPDAKPADKAATPDAPADPSAADQQGDGDVSLGDAADIQTEELTPELARKALDGYAMVHEKYQDSPLEDYSDLQEFADKDPKGKQFEADIKAFGFSSVGDWNLAVTSVSVAYNNVLDDQTADIKQQIEDVQKSVDMAQDMKDKTIKSLQASIPSENNTKIIQDLIKDKAYAEKIKLLESSGE